MIVANTGITENKISVYILGYTNITVRDKKFKIHYELQVSKGSNKWTILHRYSDFFDLHFKLKPLLIKVNAKISPFPQKIINVFGKLTKK